MDIIDEKIRLDKWLWAARFFRTRAMASQAVAGGKVQVNDQRAKPSRLVQIGDGLRITHGEFTSTVQVRAVSDKRRPAAEARLLYEESAESIKAREEEQALRKMIRAGQTAPAGRPGKRDRRKIREFIRKE
ncbi:MAG: S4 domain-containing protein [Desulfocapsaceae bacterium]|nr:S4 domain-containing protein [Desulfocapsaceae bacterium]